MFESLTAQTHRQVLSDQMFDNSISHTYCQVLSSRTFEILTKAHWRVLSMMIETNINSCTPGGLTIGNTDVTQSGLSQGSVRAAVRAQSGLSFM